MTESLQILLSELERFGDVNDHATAERPRRMLNITRDTGEFLSVLVQATCARRVLEIGTSNGYSTLWLANAARATGGAVTTVELSDYKVGLARHNFSRSGLASSITLVQDDAGRVLERAVDASFDLVFLDSERLEYPGWWPHLKRVLRPGGLLAACRREHGLLPIGPPCAQELTEIGVRLPVVGGKPALHRASKFLSDRLLVVDNATSHPEQMAPFVALVKADADFTTSLVPIGNGEFLAVKAA